MLFEAKVDDYMGLLLPGGVINPEALRSDETAAKFVKSCFDADKPVVAICHGAQTLIEADVVKGKTMTLYKSISTDLKNAGAIWKD